MTHSRRARHDGKTDRSNSAKVPYYVVGCGLRPGPFTLEAQRQIQRPTRVTVDEEMRRKVAFA